MRKKSSRENFIAAQLSAGIAAQLLTMREARGWTQKELGEKAGMADARISVMESPSYERFTLSTLRRLASALDVALIVRFAPFSEFVDWIADLTPDRLNAPSYSQDRLATTKSTRIQAIGLPPRRSTLASGVMKNLTQQQALPFADQKDVQPHALPSQSKLAALSLVQSTASQVHAA
jgi:transcriptional regulator with XRE-family HTH domain